jgi:5-methyltetrahydropteroyltriglutamate--homocysteine methyltransferase
MMNNCPLFPVTVVGSLPRSKPVLAALRKRQKGEMTGQEFAAIADAAVIEAQRLQEESEVDIVSDGEQRRDNFYSFIADHLAGIRLMTLAEMLEVVEDKAAFERLLTALDVPAFALKNPVVIDRLERTSPLVLDDFLFLKKHTNKAIKVTLPGPYLLTRSTWVKTLSAQVYPDKESLGSAVVRVLREELSALIQAGCEFVQFDEPVLSEVAFAGPHQSHTFMCAALSEKSSPDEELRFAVDLLNRVVEGTKGKIKTALHVCRGNWSRRDDVLLSGAYDPLIPYFSQMCVDQFVLEYATPRAGGFDALARLPEDKEIGLGLVDPRRAELEPVESLVQKVRSLLNYRRPEQIFLNPDCGFGTFADRPINTTEMAAAKLRAISEAARILRADD